MRRPHRTRLITGVIAAAVATACNGGDTVPVPDRDGALKSVASARAERRAYDGAPPTIPHANFGLCTACHNAQGQAVDGVGFAPASPHGDGPDAGGTTRCNQCHVFVTTDGEFVESEFVGLAQDLRPGGRATAGAPPTIPHRVLMRQNCQACHTGPGAREEVRTSHPERTRCRQCHVEVTTRDEFDSDLRPEGVDG
jgi:cytochrome c-type protein NapB